METLILPRYISAEEFDLMFEDELDRFFDDEYCYHQWLEEDKINKQLN
jgi:hypothetical protein